MIPNFIWFAVPTENDVLRGESITPVLDFIASVFQVIMVIALCLIKNVEYRKPNKVTWKVILIAALVVYFVGWCLYYSGIINAFIIMILCIAPCVAFIVFSATRQNGLALISAILFMICHVILNKR